LFPGWGSPAYALGLALLSVGSLIRVGAATFYMEFLDGYSLVFWLAGAIALVGGAQVLLWALPSVGFLFFMIPLPFGLETALSQPLQRIATELSCFALQVLGQPAFSEGNVILLGDHPLEVERACSGLRLFMSMVAVAYAYAVFVRRTWWEKALLFAAIVPVALIANAVRITVTGLLFQYTTGDLARQFAHDWAGYAMILLAMGLFGAVLWFLSQALREEEVVEMSALVREAKL
jgi:exosortase